MNRIGRFVSVFVFLFVAGCQTTGGGYGTYNHTLSGQDRAFIENQVGRLSGNRYQPKTIYYDTSPIVSDALQKAAQINNMRLQNQLLQQQIEMNQRR